MYNKKTGAREGQFVSALYALLVKALLIPSVPLSFSHSFNCVPTQCKFLCLLI